MTTVNKNILVVSNLALKLFEYHKDSLIKVIRGFFEGKTEMIFAHHMVAKKKFCISNE